MRHVGRPFLHIFTEKMIVKASSVQTHRKFACVHMWHTIACEKMVTFHDCKTEHLVDARPSQTDARGLYCNYMSTWTKCTQLLHARVSDPHRLPRQISMESEFERKLCHVGRPFLRIFTEKMIANASSVQTQRNFAFVLVWPTVACEKNGDVP